MESNLMPAPVNKPGQSGSPEPAKEPDYIKPEFSISNGTLNDIKLSGFGQIEDMQIKLTGSETTGLIPRNFTHAQWRTMPEAHELSAEAARANFAGAFSMTNPFGNLQVSSTGISGELKLEKLNLQYNDGFVHISMADKPLSFSMKDSVYSGHYKGQLLGIRASYDKMLNKFTDGGFSLGDDQIKLSLGAKEDFQSLDFKLLDPINTFTYGLKYDHNVRGHDYATMTIGASNGLLNLRFSPDGQIIDVNGIFKVEENACLSGGTIFSKESIEANCGLSYFSKLGEISFKLNAGKQFDSPEFNFGGALNLDIKFPK